MRVGIILLFPLVDFDLKKGIGFARSVVMFRINHFILMNSILEESIHC
jgi:hypothetical protein